MKVKVHMLDGTVREVPAKIDCLPDLVGSFGRVTPLDALRMPTPDVGWPWRATVDGEFFQVAEREVLGDGVVTPLGWRE